MAIIIGAGRSTTQTARPLSASRGPA